MNIPELVFIVPYRDREAHFNAFMNHMPYILENMNNYEIFFIQPVDDKPFNRGAMKNIGFLIVKDQYPEDYKDITLVFHDIDTMPGKKGLWDYNTTNNIIKHFYGFNFALGGIVSIKCSDFEKINGFPNFWGWGYEDNCLQKRALNHNLQIDRSIFYEYGDKDILQYFHSFKRNCDKNIVQKSKNEDGTNGINTIQNLNYTFNFVKERMNIIYIFDWEIPEKHTSVNFIIHDQTEVKKKRKNNIRRIGLLKR